MLRLDVYVHLKFAYCILKGFACICLPLVELDTVFSQKWVTCVWGNVRVVKGLHVTGTKTPHPTPHIHNLQRTSQNSKVYGYSNIALRALIFTLDDFQPQMSK